jgi:hypothetical protein
MLFTFDQPLSLCHKKPLARGTHRALYRLEEAPHLLVKVLDSSAAPAPTTTMRRWKRKLHQALPALSRRFLFREYRAYLKAKLQQELRKDELPVAEQRGLVLTDMGIGMLVELIGDSKGNPGPTLWHLYKDGRLESFLVDLNDFARRMFAWGIRANDINVSNIVLGQRNGQRQFVLVDGLGDSHLIPMRSWFKVLNERSLHKRFRKLARALGLRWNSRDLAFTALDGEVTITPART